MATPDTLAPVSVNTTTWAVVLDGTQTDDTRVQITSGHALRLGVKATSGNPAGSLVVAPGEIGTYEAGTRLLAQGIGTIDRQPITTA